MLIKGRLRMRRYLPILLGLLCACTSNGDIATDTDAAGEHTKIQRQAFMATSLYQAPFRTIPR
jgi:hypothetical protein